MAFVKPQLRVRGKHACGRHAAPREPHSAALTGHLKIAQLQTSNWLRGGTATSWPLCQKCEVSQPAYALAYCWSEFLVERSGLWLGCSKLWSLNFSSVQHSLTLPLGT